MKKISIYDYIISNNPTAIRPLMQKYGKPYPANWNEFSEAQKLVILRNTMIDLIRSGNKDFERDLISLHPDKEIIEDYLLEKQSKNDNANKHFATKELDTEIKEVKSDVLNVFSKQNTKTLVFGAVLGLASYAIIKTLNNN